MSEAFDLLVIGGGINGVGIARDAAGRDLSVLLCEKSDLAGATSSASSKLIHGGLRYLEHGDVRLVREGLAEREVLLRMAPHLVRPMAFVLPQDQGSRPAWLVRRFLRSSSRIGRSVLIFMPGSYSSRSASYRSPRPPLSASFCRLSPVTPANVSNIPRPLPIIIYTR